ncbi:YggT family protein [Oceanobacillus senegalensis]|uniref:YggT family protein n=1 Tax=Oceanobacillus senegalensis TaxID=1936063 RepID=UPI000A30B8B3|nr:YggT family protein [Oceanobacillus senegalensis]
MGQLYSILSLALNLYSWAIIIYIFMSWFPGARESSFGEMLGRIVEPYLEIFRRFIPPLGMIDLSPIVAIFVLYLARIGLLEFFRMFLF